MINHESTCGWVESSQYQGKTSSGMVCEWRRPTIHPATVIIYSMLVTAVATPIYLVIAYLIDSVLLAPTAEEVMQQLHYVLPIRKSAIRVANHQQEAQSTMQCSGQQANMPPRPKLFRTFSKVDECVLKRQQTMRHSMQQSAFFDSFNAETLKHDNHFDSLHNLKTELGIHSSWLLGRKHQDFLSHWPIYSDIAMAAVQEELETVVKVSQEWKETLKRAPPASTGIRLLQLFVQDLIGRKSRQARVFVNHLEEQQLEEKMVMSLGAKALAFAAIILMNLYFIFSCMLYGRNNGWYRCSLFLTVFHFISSIQFQCVPSYSIGIKWQHAWLFGSLFSTAVDCCISQGLQYAANDRHTVLSLSAKRQPMQLCSSLALRSFSLNMCFIHSFVRSFIHSFIHSVIHPFIHFVSIRQFSSWWWCTI